MAEAKVIDVKGNSKDSKQLEGPLFNSEVNSHLLHECIIGYKRNLRQGTSATKTRTMVRGGGKKPWRQKGTGRARSGSNTSPIWTGGGIAWGPHPREYYRPLPKQFKRSALYSAFSLRASEGKIRIADLPDLSEAKTRVIADWLKGLGIYQARVLLLYENRIDNLIKSCRNIQGLEAKRSILVNPFDLIWAEHVLVTPDAFAKIEEVFGK